MKQAFVGSETATHSFKAGIATMGAVIANPSRPRGRELCGLGTGRPSGLSWRTRPNWLGKRPVVMAAMLTGSSCPRRQLNALGYGLVRQCFSDGRRMTPLPASLARNCAIGHSAEFFRPRRRMVPPLSPNRLEPEENRRGSPSRADPGLVCQCTAGRPKPRRGRRRY
jgi:hypothetical protein